MNNLNISSAHNYLYPRSRFKFIPDNRHIDISIKEMKELYLHDLITKASKEKVFALKLNLKIQEKTVF